MEWYTYALIAVGVLVLALIIINLLKEYRYIKIIESVKQILFQHLKKGEIIEHNPEHIYHVEFQNEKAYLIKLLDMNQNHEVIITNADNVVINHDISNWKRSTKPHFVPGMKEFIKYHIKDMECVKIVLIYPNCHNITKYINESDCYIVQKFQKVDGIYFLRYEELGEFLENQ